MSTINESSDAVFVYARRLHNLNKDYLVCIHPDRGVPDEGDIFLTFMPTGFRLVIDVKRTSYHFTCRGDWPFPDFIVNNGRRAGVFNADHYIYLNKAMTHFAWLPGAVAKANWWDENIRNSRYPSMGNQYPVKKVSPDLVRFKALDDPTPFDVP